MSNNNNVPAIRSGAHAGARKMLSMVFSAFTLFAVSGNSAFATDAILAAGPIFGGATQSKITCYVGNYGKPDVTISSADILSQSGVALDVTGSTCQAGTVLKSGSSCYLVASETQAVSCVIKAKKVNNLRGELEIRNDTETTVLNSIELR